MDTLVRSAVAQSSLGTLPPDALDGLVADAVRTRLPPGAVSSRAGGTTPHLDLVVSGLVRVFVVAPDGRTLTVRYVRPGGLVGTVSLFASEYSTPVTTQAVLDSELLKISAEVAARMASTDTRVARAFLTELSQRVMAFIQEIPDTKFTTVRERVARHLLDLATSRLAGAPDRSPHEVVARVTQQELAEAVGSAREVVVRVLREMRREGLVRTGRDRIVLLDPARLSRPPVWNPRS